MPTLSIRTIAMRATAAAVVAVVAAITVAAPIAARPSSVFPEVIELPAGWRPEGIAVGPGARFYVGSLANGAIYRGDLRTGEGTVWVPGRMGDVAVGLELDDRQRLWVAGGPTGTGKVYDTKTGELLATYTFANASFVNDVVVTRDAAYFTDSNRAQLFIVALNGGRDVPASQLITATSLTGDFPPPGSVGTPNANGIETTTNGQALLVVHTTTGQLFRVDPDTGVAHAVVLTGGTLVRGDGIIRRGRTLYVVQNLVNQVAVVTLDPHGTTGTIEQILTDPDLDVPATAGLFGSSIYAVNARFTTPPGPQTAYQVVRLDRSR